jgi:two-component system response regulator YesN
MDQLRFERARQLMSDPEIKLEEVAERCGYQSASAFSRAFKTMFGCGPSAWRGH